MVAAGLVSLVCGSLIAQAQEPVGPPEWTASWIWGVGNEDGGPGFFRREFHLERDATRFVLQSSGDDGYALFVDGREVHRGGFWWERTDVTELGPLAAGRHVVAARVDNAARPGGLLVEAWAVGDDWREGLFTDPTWRFATEAPEAFMELDLDDSEWGYALSIGTPPVAPWGPLPLRYIGPELPLEWLGARLRSEGNRVIAESRVRVLTPCPLPRETVVALARGGRTFAQVLLEPRPRTEDWTEGQVVTLKGEVTLGPFCPAGEYDVALAPCGSTLNGQPTLSIGSVLLGDAGAEYPRAEVRPHNGAPALFVDDEPVFPLMLMSVPIDPVDVAAGQEVGWRLQTIDVDSGWRGVDTYEFSRTEEAIRRALEAAPDSLLLLRVFMVAPGPWLDAYPEEIIEYANPDSWTSFGMSGPRHPSFASQRWRDDAEEALRRLVRHLREVGYADSILGFHIAAGIYGEWHYWNSPYHPDTSDCFARAYVEWLRERYPENTPEPRIPTLEERRHGDAGMFRDPIASRWLVDYGRCLHEQGADAVIQLARAVKDETDGRALTVAFNGYLPDLNWNMEGDHRRFDKVLRSPYLDAFASPHSYFRRGVGEDAITRGFPATVRAMGKLWLDEEDDRTSLASDPPHTHVTSIEESVEVLWRGFAQMLTLNVGGWYMDQQGGWYRDPAIQEAFAQMQRIADASMHKPRTRVSEVAVVASFDTAFYLADRSSGDDRVTNALINDQLRELSHSGAPFDLYLMSELFEPGVPDYRAYVFLDTFYMDDENYDRVRELAQSGRTVVFLYAPGFVSDQTLSLERVEELVGRQLTLSESMTLPGDLEQRPGIAVPDSDERLVRSGEVWFCAAPPVSAEELRGVFDEAGVHLYSRDGDVLMAGGGYLAVHASSTGAKVLSTPAPMRWINARTGELLAESSNTVEIALERGETLLIELQ